MQDKRRYSTLAAPHLDRTCFQVASRHQAIAATTNPYWHQLSIRAAPYSLHDNLVQSSQFSPLFGAFSTHGTEWSVEPVLPTTFATPLSVDAAQSISYATHADYPESSQRTELSSSPVNAPVDYSYRSDAPKSPSQSPDFSEGRRLYTMDDMDAPASCRSSSLPPIKMEQQDVDGCFVMELSAAQVKAISLSQSMAPPTEVPLRATHASAEMRKMMGRFRIDPFAIHSGENRGIVASWCGEACPLEEEPLIFEFQLDIGNVHSDTQEGSSIQADLETQTVDSDAAGTQWDEYCSNELIHSEWDEEHRSSEPVAEYYRRQVQEMQESKALCFLGFPHVTVVPAYLHKCAQGSSIHLASNPSQDLDHTGDRSEFWPRNGSFNAPLRRSTTYTADSPACNVSK
jgi:hypothetical protein